jgi:hypothetical protein
VDRTKRLFFRNLFRSVAQSAVDGYRIADEKIREEEDLDRFFESYESSSALTLNYPDEILIESARLEGIEVEGRDKLDIVRDMFRKRGSE